MFTDPNRIDPVTHTRPYPNFASMTEYWGCCNTSYEALQVSLKRRFSHRLAFNVNYTMVTRSIKVNLDSAAARITTMRSIWNMPAPILTSGTRSIDYTYQLPAAPLLPKWLGGGWQANGLTVMRSGTPVNVTIQLIPPEPVRSLAASLMILAPITCQARISGRRTTACRSIRSTSTPSKLPGPRAAASRISSRDV